MISTGTFLLYFDSIRPPASLILFAQRSYWEMVVDFEPSTNRPDMPTAVPKRILVGASAAAYSFRGRLSAPTMAALPLINERLSIVQVLPFLFIQPLESVSARVFRGAHLRRPTPRLGATGASRRVPRHAPELQASPRRFGDAHDRQARNRSRRRRCRGRPPRQS